MKPLESKPQDKAARFAKAFESLWLGGAKTDACRALQLNLSRFFGKDI